MKHVQSEVEATFRYWLKRLEKLCEEYDKGDERSALLMSAGLRLLLKTKSRTVSLVDQMGLGSLPFLDSRKSPRGLSFCNVDGGTHNLSVIMTTAVDIYMLGVHIKNSPEGIISYECTPILGRNSFRSSEVSFEEWYNQTVFALPGLVLTRKDLIESIAEQDGGVHFDENLSLEAYCALRRGDAFQWNVNGTIVEFENNPAYASLRQIAYEVLTTFNSFR